MCSKATCRKCGKTTWSGCGNHVKQVMRGVPAVQQCTCASASDKQTPAAAALPATGEKRGRFTSLFRR
ncbi:MAG: hypothetical protein WD794_12045 [Mycobacteriales bacterium]